MQSQLDPHRLERGYVIVLPGIEGHSFLNRGIVRGLVDGGVPYAIENYNWTGGLLAFFANLRSTRRHRRQAELLREKILGYQDRFPGRPVYLIGHSGGAALSLLTLAGLPLERKVSGAVLLSAAISARYDCGHAIARTTRGIWNVSSWGDFPTLGVATTVIGGVDGWHMPCAGLCGFLKSPSNIAADSPETESARADSAPKLIELPYRVRMARHGNLSGHFGSTNRRFIQNWIAPILNEQAGPT
jgi:pimeloyl-ACP methyl ester carboxylesterase